MTQSTFSRRHWLAVAATASVGCTRSEAREKNARKEPKTVKIVEFSDRGVKQQVVEKPVVDKTKEQWREQLDRQAYHILRESGTEMATSGEYDKLYKDGIYRCQGCGTALFSSETKYRSGSGWPSFWEPMAKENVKELTDSSYGMSRTEVRCALCDGHLGHIFPDGPKPTGQRYCINSAALKFAPAPSQGGSQSVKADSKK